MKDIFERLSAGRPQQAERAHEQPRRGDDRKTFLVDILMNGPAPTNLVYQRGTARGFTKKQIWSAREKMKIVAFKETGKHGGRWFLMLPQHAGYSGTAGHT
jgi:hypothetical protein